MSYIDRAVYLHSIDTNNIDYNSIILKYFDQLMSIYGLLQTCNYTVKVLPSNNESLILDLVFSDDSSISRVLNIFNDNRFTLYERTFTMNIIGSNSNSIQLYILAN